MYSKFTLAGKFLHYYFTASNGRGHGIHSPFIFQFVQQVLSDKKHYYAFKNIEEARKRMLEDHSVIRVEDKGAGSRVGHSGRGEGIGRQESGQQAPIIRERSIQEIARTSLKPRKYAQLLFRIVNFYNPRTILELGTSLGITTAYMASANPGAQVTTIEGAEAVAHTAIGNFSRLDLRNITQVTGNFDEVLQPTLQSLPSIDLAFVDGNHRREPTVRYFHEILARCHKNSILIFDDIHWSAEMEAAWEDIRHHAAVTCTVDLFFIGLVFLKDEFKTKQHFVIRF